MTTVYANGFSITHKGDGQVDVAAPPDVCKTPSPGGPIPVPYVNIAKTSDLTKGSTSTSIEGNPAALESSQLMLSSGDEAGTLGGVISNKFKGQAGWTTFSSDVEIEGKGVVRFSDVVQQNGNTYNTAFLQQGGTGFAYGDDTQCTLCGEPPAKHRVLDTVASALGIAEILARLHANPGRYLTRGKKKKKGFMVGVLTCHCRRWATTSGETPDDFASAAPGYEIVGGGGVSAEELSGGDPAAAAALTDAFEQIAVNRENPEIAHRYSIPGMCAATKLMRAARGHELLAMTEAFFSSATWRGNYEVDYTNRIVNRLIPMSFRQMTQAEAAAGATNRTVASCQSCQLILPMTLCQLQDWRC